ncbi:MAG: hypothetical protein K2W99_01105 [Chthoniobacterales bacterium]|nr:hypothetical protein [Chthoniobacterales bacterium]
MNRSYEKLIQIFGLIDPHVALAESEQEARLEEERGYPEIAAYWRKMACAINVVLENHHFLGKIQDIKKIPPVFEAKEIFSAAQTSTHHIADSLKAIAIGDFFTAQQLASAAKRLTSVAKKFEYWRRRAHEEAVAARLFDEKETTEMVSLYRTHQALASFAHQQRLAQQWAEAACLAQSATIKIKKMALLLTQKENSTRVFTLFMAAYWAKQAALVRAKVAVALEQGNKKEIQHAIKIACAAEEAATYRSKAARTIKENDPMISHYLTMAAYWAANNARYQEQRSPLWKRASFLAKRTSYAYAQAAKNKTTSPHSALLLRFWRWRIARAEQQLEIVLQEISREHAAIENH